MTLDEVIAREAIRYTMSVYTNAGDRGALDELVSAFAPDGTIELFGGTHTGREAIAAKLGSLIDPNAAGPDRVPLGFMRHNLTSCRIEMRGDSEANAWTYFNVLTPLGLDHCGVYVDRFAKHGDRWLIAHRRIKIDWVHPASLVITP